MSRPVPIFLLMWLVASPGLVTAAAPDFHQDVMPILRKYCNGCHNAREQAAGLVLEDYARIIRGGENGAVIVAGKSEQSQLWKVLSGKAEPRMPPEDAPQLSPADLKILQSWIDAGAAAPSKEMAMPKLAVPQVQLRVEPREPVTALAADPLSRRLAGARPNRVEIVELATSKPVTTLTGHLGSVADVRFSSTGDFLVVAAGEPGLSGEATLWRTSDWSRQQVMAGHRDALYAVAISPDDRQVATASYDRDARLWDLATGTPQGRMTGHNDAIYALAYHPNGQWLATASGDRTVKLWNVATRERLETFSQPAKEQYSVSISPDGRFLAGGGVDNRIRVWEFGPQGKEGTNPIRYARFAHEAPILRVQFSPDGKLLASCSEERRIKIWETRNFTQVALLERQSDWPSAVSFTPDSRHLWIGRMDGSLKSYEMSPKWADAPAALRRLDETPETVRLERSSELEEIAEVEPNDRPSQAQRLSLPLAVKGKLFQNSGDADDDLYRIACRAGETWIFETNAAQSKSPADTKLEVLDLNGRPVRRALLQAVRDSWINFRPIDSSQLQVRVEFWEEMDLNQYLYMNGEVGRFYRAPRGPDSGYDFYDNRGKRRTYFDTTPITHAKDELVYVVEAYAPDAALIDNGLPVFPINYINDDDAERELGADSRLTFTAPADGDYLVRVSDARGFGGPDFSYSLTLRPIQPDFSVKLETKTVKLNAASGQRLKFYADRKDNFQGPIRIEISDVPPGFHIASPTVIEAGHLEAFSVLIADENATSPNGNAWKNVKIVARADVHGTSVEHPVEGFSKVTLEKTASFRADLIPDSAASTAEDGGLLIEPGTTITAMIRVERNGYDGDIKFDVDNLPHGIIVDNIGLSGVLVRKNENERQIFLTARPWVPASTRWINAVAQQQEKVATPPIRLHVRPADKVARGR